MVVKVKVLLIRLWTKCSMAISALKIRQTAIKSLKKIQLEKSEAMVTPKRGFSTGGRRALNRGPPAQHSFNLLTTIDHLRLADG